MTNSKDNKTKAPNVPPLRFPEFTDEWVEITIQNLATVLGGGTPDTTNKSYWDGNIQWFTPSEIGKNKYVNTSLRTITEDGLNNSSAKLLPPHTILLSSRATVGECSLTLQECATNQGFQSLIAKNCDTDFLYYLIQTKKKELIKKSCGSTFLEISANEVRKIKVAIPTKEEQLKISLLLSLLDERIATQNKIIEDLKKLKSAIIEDIMNNSHAAYFTLGEVGTYVRGLTFSSDDIEDDSSALRVFRANNLNYGDYVSTKDVIYVEKIPTSPQILQPGDIVICMANGSSNLVGKNSVYNDENKFSTIGAFCGIYRTSESFVRWFLESTRYRYMVAKALQGGNGAIANLSGTDILNMKFPIITEPMKSIYNKLLTGLNNNIQTNNQLISLLLQKKAYLLKQLFI